MSTTHEQKLREVVAKVEPDFEFEGQFDLQSEINAYAQGFDDAKEKVMEALTAVLQLEREAARTSGEWMQYLAAEIVRYMYGYYEGGSAGPSDALAYYDGTAENWEAHKSQRSIVLSYILKHVPAQSVAPASEAVMKAAEELTRACFGVDPKKSPETVKELSAILTKHLGQHAASEEQRNKNKGT